MTILQERLVAVLKEKFTERELDLMYNETPNEAEFWIRILNATGSEEQGEFL